MTVLSNTHKLVLFPLCDQHGALSEALKPVRHKKKPDAQTRSDAVLFAWMLSLPTAIDAVAAARAMLTVAKSQLGQSATAYQRELMSALSKYVDEEGNVSTLRRDSRQQPPRKQWRLREALRRKGKISD